MNPVGYMAKRFEIRATESNAHFLGIMMGASVRREGGKLIILRHDINEEVPLGHWIVLEKGGYEICKTAPCPI